MDLVDSLNDEDHFFKYLREEKEARVKELETEATQKMVNNFHRIHQENGIRAIEQDGRFI